MISGENSMMNLAIMRHIPSENWAWEECEENTYFSNFYILHQYIDNFISNLSQYKLSRYVPVSVSWYDRQNVVWYNS